VGEIQPGATVQVIGETEDGRIKAEQIRLVALPGVTPPADPGLIATPEFQSSTPESEGQPEEVSTPEPGEDSGSGESHQVEGFQTPGATQEPNSESETGLSATGTPRPGPDDSETEASPGGETEPTAE
jgi:hypothetical protein